MIRYRHLTLLLTILLATTGARAQEGWYQVRRKLTPSVQRAIGSGTGAVRVLVRMRGQHGLPAISGLVGADNAVRTALRREEARRSAGMLLDFLATRQANGLKATPLVHDIRASVTALAAPAPRVQELWIANTVLLEADAALLRELAARPDVERIYRDVRVQAIPSRELIRKAGATAMAAGGNWAVDKVRARDAWSTYGVRGEGVVIGHIDTGVDAAHPALEGRVLRFRDFVNGKTEPYDDEGHGTHTAGSICASGDGIGVAPGARLVVAKALDNEGSGELSKLLAAMQWMLDPDGDPSTNDRPTAVSCSWGVDRRQMKDLGAEETFFWDAVQAWRDADMLPVFASGNSGPSSEVIPGAYPISLAVGATDAGDSSASYSSGGPSTWNGLTYTKPDLCAPGSAIVSTVPGGQTRSMSGTSMACPVVAGVAALIKQARPQASAREIEQILLSSVVDLGDPGKDVRFGAGRIDALAAVAKAKQAASPAPAPVVRPTPPAAPPTHTTPGQRQEIQNRISRGVLMLVVGLVATFGLQLLFG
ncbi:MAG: S8 family serine peptidase [Candidatus Wallbacteria bacterium]|nr:S8 family serine peptidase [Candidatus Wallbacteria bacterium]